MKPLFQDRICAVVAAKTAREMNRALALALRTARTAELRLDYLPPRERAIFVGRLAKQRRVTLIATCRLKDAGGQWEAKPGDDVAGVLLARQAGCDWCDVSTQTITRPEMVHVRRLLLSRGRSIASFHDFERTPSGLPGLVSTLTSQGWDAVKVATHCKTIRDSLRVLELCDGRRNVIAVPMGEIGLPARVLALKHGSALAYAAAGEETAPGQLTLDEMKGLYRADRLDKHTRVYGVIGNPVSHSLSPLLHNTGFIARRMNDVYLPFLVNDLRDFLSAIKPLGIRGFSVTIPYKEKILRHLNDCDPLAEAIGAVNTVVVRGNGKLYGMNTDYVGVLRALQKRVNLRGSRVLLYGAGGVARSVAFALAQEGAIAAICARRPEHARKLAKAVGGEAIERRHLSTEYFDAIVNCTPVGMHPHSGESPLRANELNCRLVFDTVYRPMRTQLLRLAERRGIETVSGVEMFLAQGMAQWEIWTEQRAPEKEMRQAVLKALRGE